MATNPVQTLVIDDFKGALTVYNDGDINSGRSYVQNSAGANPFIKPGNLTWNNAPVQINPAENIITDLILAGKERVESGILYVYAIGHTGRLYKIQVNNPATYNPDYDNPVLLATLTAGTPTFTRGAFMDFFGNTERIFIGHDKGVTRIDFDGTNETVVGVLGSWTQNVPRPLKQFIGNLYAGNGANLTEIIQAGTVSTYAKLSPAFPTNTQTRDIDVSTDGTYLQAVVTRLALPDITSTTQNADQSASADSFIFKWNGVDAGYTAFDTFPSFTLTANQNFANSQYTFGTDQYGSAVYAPTEKIISGTELESPLPNAVVSTGNLLTWITPVYFNGVQEADMYCWGNFDFEVGYPGYWDLFFLNAKAPETDIIVTPFQIAVSNAGLGASSNGYANNVYSTSKIYFSTLETSSAPTTKYRFYKWSPISSPDIPSGTPIPNAIYQTQVQLFSKKVQIKEVRVYGEPWVAGNEFTVDIIGSAGTPIAGASKTFTAGSNLTVGDDFAWYTPQAAPTYAIGVAITNTGTTNHTINKIEVDYAMGGK